MRGLKSCLEDCFGIWGFKLKLLRGIRYRYLRKDWGRWLRVYVYVGLERYCLGENFGLIPFTRGTCSGIQDVDWSPRGKSLRKRTTCSGFRQ